jgi:REP element-mobilizing transposase RayT
MPTRSKSRIHRKAIDAPGHAHELTFSCYQRFPFLKTERTCQWLADAIQVARAKHSFDLWAFVIMPEHVHLIVRPRQAECEMRKIMAGIKLPVARRAIHYLEEANSPWLAKITRPGGTGEILGMVSSCATGLASAGSEPVGGAFGKLFQRASGSRWPIGPRQNSEPTIIGLTRIRRARE